MIDLAIIICPLPFPPLPGNEVDPFKPHEHEAERRASQQAIRILSLEEGGLEDQKKEPTEILNFKCA